MPPVVPALTAIGGGSALAGGALVAGTAATLGSAAADRSSQKKLQQSAERQKAESQEFIKQQIAQGRTDLFKLFPSAQDSQQKGLEAGLDIYRQTLPAQVGSFREGNVGAQQQLINALPQIQNALLGQPVDLSGMQPTTVKGGLGGLTMPQAPQFQQINDLGLGGDPGSPPPPPQQLDPQTLALLQAMRAQGAI